MSLDPSRRRLLQLGIGGSALLAVGGVGLSLRAPVAVPVSGLLQVFSEREHSICAAIADTMCPGGPGLPSASELGVPSKLDALLATVHPGVGKEIRQVLHLMENPVASLVFDRRLTPFSHLDAAARAVALERWRSSGLAVRRQAYKGLHGLINAAYWGDQQAYAHTGYPGPPDYGNRTPAPVVAP